MSTLNWLDIYILGVLGALLCRRSERGALRFERRWRQKKQKVRPVDRVLTSTNFPPTDARFALHSTLVHTLHEHAFIL